VRAADLLVDGKLRGQTRTGVCFGQAVSRHQAAQLFLDAAGGDDDGIEVVLVPRLEQQRNIGDGGDRRQRQLPEPVADPAIDVGVDDRLEVAAGDAVGEDEPRQRRTIERAVLAEDVGAEALDDRGEPVRPRRARQ
jgi:hypothetical protein